MVSFQPVHPGDPMQAHQVQQVIDALIGTPGAGVPLSPTQVNDTINYALSVENTDPANSRALNVMKADGSVLVRADATGVTLGAPVNLTANSVAGSAIQDASITNAKLGPDVARANLLTNGGFEIWQRGNGPNSGSGVFVAGDRWVSSLAGSDAISVSKDTTNVDTGSQACAACAFTLGTGGGASTINQKIPSTDGYQLAGRQMTLSVRVRTATANAVRIGLFDGSAWTQSAFHTGSGAYQTLTVTTTMSGPGTNWQCGIFFAASCTAYVDNAMLVVGSQPANYVPLHPAEDLARCLRYYEVLLPNVPTLTGQATTATGGLFPYAYKVVKAVTPTVTISAAASHQVTNAAGSPIVPTSVTANLIGVGSCQLGVLVASGLVAGNASVFQAATAAQLISVEANP